MINLTERIGNFTSSQIYRLMGTPSVRETYLKEKRAERALKRSVDLGAYSKSMTFGKIMEAFIFSQEKYFPTGSGWELCNKTTVIHPKIKCFAGSPDALEKQTCGEIKCFEPKGYYEISNALIRLKNGDISLDEFKKDFKEVYWQVVANSIITNKPKCAIFVYIPSLEELEYCISLINETNFCEKIGLDEWMYRYIVEHAEKEELYKLPYIDTSKTDWPNFVKYEFQAPAEDIIQLTKAVLDAEKLLIDA